MDVARLETFRDVARGGSIAAAARRAGCAPSIVSRRIAALEAALGVRLLARSTRRLELTEAGEAYLRRIEPLLDELLLARDEARGLVGQPRGVLRATASSSFGQAVIGPLLLPFQNAFPEVQVELLLTDALLDLVAERVDVALRLGPRPVGDWIVARVAPTAMRLVARADVVAVGAIARPADVAGYPCLLTAAQSRADWRFRRGGSEEIVPVLGTIATSNTLVVRRCVLDGLGLAVLADWLVDADAAAGRLRVLLPGWEVAVRGFDTGIWVVDPSRAFLPMKTRAFIDHVTRHVGRRP